MASRSSLILSAAIFFNTFTNGVRHHEEYLLGDIAYDHRALLYTRGDIRPKALIDHMLFAADPEFHFCAQICNVLVVHSIENDGGASGTLPEDG